MAEGLRGFSPQPLGPIVPGQFYSRKAIVGILLMSRVAHVMIARRHREEVMDWGPNILSWASSQ